MTPSGSSWTQTTRLGRRMHLVRADGDVELLTEDDLVLEDGAERRPGSR